MKSVLLFVHDDAGQEARILGAIDLTRALGGHLTCLDVAMMPLPVVDPYGAGGDALLLDRERQRESANRARLSPRIEAAGVPHHWIDLTAEPVRALSHAARLADVIVVNRANDGLPGPDMRRLVGKLLVKARAPILAMPPKATGFFAGGHTMVAWDGSVEAALALRQAVPLLARASAVTVVTVDDGSVDGSAEAAAAYLEMHDIAAAVRAEPLITDVASDLLDLVASYGAAWLVSGGYGHGRWIEAITGGTTRRLLGACPVPLFLAH